MATPDPAPPGPVPAFEMRHRMARALEHAHVSVSAMADELGVTRNTVGNYLAGRTPPKRGQLVVWALRCGVPLAWLLHGTESGPGGSPNRTEQGVTIRYPQITQLRRAA